MNSGDAAFHCASDGPLLQAMNLYINMLNLAPCTNLAQCNRLNIIFNYAIHNVPFEVLMDGNMGGDLQGRFRGVHVVPAKSSIYREINML